MADVQIVSSAKTIGAIVYTVPESVELTLKAVYCEFRDAGAAFDWTPVVEIVSDSGHSIAVAIDRSALVTAGGDADASWFPGVKGGAGSGTAGRMPVLYLVGTASGVQASVSGVGFNRQFYQAGGFSYQPDTTVYSVNDLGGGLCDTVTFLQAGQYMVTAGFLYESAAAFYREWSLRFTSGVGLPLPRSFTVPTQGANEKQVGMAQLFEATPAAVAGGLATCLVAGVQTSGGNIGVAEGYLSIIQLSAVAQ